jgi:nicotinamidase-related amidase
MKTHELASVPTSLAEFVDPRSTALILWDFQKGLAGKASSVESVSRNARILIDAADKAGVLVVWSRHLLPPLDLTVGPFLLFLMRKQNVDHPSKLKPFMQQGSEDTEFLDGFKPAPHHIVLEKSMPSFFVDTPLDLRLKARNIRSVVLTGVATDIGIDFTARHAVAKGYYPVVAEDACGAYSQGNHDRSMAFLRTGATVATTAEIAAIWSRHAS